jgi:hypothetical protein
MYIRLQEYTWSSVVLDVDQIRIIKKQEIKQIFFNTTIIYWEYQLFVNKKMSHILLLFYFHEKNK